MTLTPDKDGALRWPGLGRVIKRVGAICVATKSFLKDIKIQDRQLAHAFVEALRQAEKSKHKQVQLTRTCTELTVDKIQEFFDRK